jgi:hypothetical protein
MKNHENHMGLFQSPNVWASTEGKFLNYSTKGLSNIKLIKLINQLLLQNL